ncbi:hypothetical protein M885DRAFT_549248 [Pelagophyceae sp. CCMP2097]|nr:hypothetical protein M885DRAFT_549248 [Pelagophyceae sp. CCMP2097]
MPAAAPGGSASPRGAADAPGVPGASGAAGAASTAGAATRWCAACRALEDADVEYAAVCASVGRARAALATVVVVSNLGATEPGASDLGVAEPGAAELGTAHAARVARLRDAARRACGGDVRVLVPVGGDRQPKALVFVEAGGARAARFVAAALRGRADHAATVEGETPDVENVGVSAVVFSDLYDHVAPSDGGGDGGSEDGRRRASSHGSTSDDAPVSDGEPDSDDEAPASAATAASGRRGPLVLLQAPTAAARPPPDEGDLLLDRCASSPREAASFVCGGAPLERASRRARRLRSGAATTLHFLERRPASAKSGRPGPSRQGRCDG